MPDKNTLDKNNLITVRQRSPHKSFIVLVSTLVISFLALTIGYQFSSESKVLLKKPSTSKTRNDLQQVIKISPTTTTPTPISNKIIHLLTESDGNLVEFNQIESSPPNSWGYEDTIAYDSAKYLYYFIDNKLVQYDLDSKTTTQTIDTFFPPQPDELTFLQYSASDNTLWLKEIQQSESTTRLTFFSLNKADPSSKPKVGEVSRPFHNPPFSSYQALGFHNEDLFLISGGGDGCGGWGTLSILKNPKLNNESNEKSPELDTLQEIINTGSGCSNNPRFIGFLPKHNSFLLYDIVPDSYDVSPIKEIYLFNYLNNSKSVLNAPQNRSENDTRIILSPSQETVALISSDSANLIPINDPTQISTVNFDSYHPLNFDESWEVDNNLYAIIDHKNLIYQINMSSGKVNQLKYSNPNPYRKPLKFLGIYNNKPLFIWIQ